MPLTVIVFWIRKLVPLSDTESRRQPSVGVLSLIAEMSFLLSNPMWQCRREWFRTQAKKRVRALFPDGRRPAGTQGPKK